jgi:hypothetical protein
MRRRELILLGGAIAAAQPLHAQQKAMPVIGFLGGEAADALAANVAASRKGLDQSARYATLAALTDKVLKGRAAGRDAGLAADTVRAGDQPKNCAGNGR